MAARRQDDVLILARKLWEDAAQDTLSDLWRKTQERVPVSLLLLLLRLLLLAVLLWFLCFPRSAGRMEAVLFSTFACVPNVNGMLSWGLPIALA